MIYSVRPGCLLPQPGFIAGTDGGRKYSQLKRWRLRPERAVGKRCQAGIVLGAGNSLFAKLPTNFRAARLPGGLSAWRRGQGQPSLAAGRPGLSHSTFWARRRRLSPEAGDCLQQLCARLRAGAGLWVLPAGVYVLGDGGVKRVGPGCPRPRPWRVCTSAPCIHPAGDGWGNWGLLEQRWEAWRGESGQAAMSALRW